MIKVKKIRNQAEKAMREAVNKVVEESKKSGILLPVWKNGKVAYIRAKNIRKTGR
jgi:hypothetical protein